MIIRANAFWRLPVTLLAIGCAQDVEALQVDPQFPGAAQARKTLASLVY